MKKNIAMRWIRALESGRYKQAKRTLCRFDEDGKKIGHCCLGVLTEIAARDNVRGAKTALKKSSLSPTQSQKSFLIPRVQSWAGIKTGYGALPEEARKRFQNSLIGFNDYSRIGFKGIARIIRKHWKEL